MPNKEEETSEKCAESVTENVRRAVGSGPMTLTPMNIMTVDVEDWYTSSLDLFPDSDVPHGSKPDQSVIENTRRVLEMLEHNGHKATFFILGTVAEHYPQIVREIADCGHEVASHGYGHYLLYNMTPEQFREDVRKSLSVLRVM